MANAADTVADPDGKEEKKKEKTLNKGKRLSTEAWCFEADSSSVNLPIGKESDNTAWISHNLNSEASPLK